LGAVVDGANSGVVPSLQGTSYSPVNHWENYPTAWHNNAAGFLLADGHAEVFQWAGTEIKNDEAKKQVGNDTDDLTGPDLADLRRVQAAIALPVGQN
jgi:prepilin-type processing-associated H-X9-DG protein